MLKKDGKLSKSVELPICPFCDGNVFYTSWVTHKIFQIECEDCGAHWRTGLKETPERDIYLELTKTMSDGKGRELINKKYSVEYWQDMVTKRIRI